ncbi:MAG: hypothetical protein AUG91_10430 [Actinobacteria bacterium 13_1_20CM_4_69_9]|nr:MAG: hypothetical protein AUG91_10430 [Actinobacteria bacterium 13_1_20CM_4_69_9]
MTIAPAAIPAMRRSSTAPSLLDGERSSDQKPSSAATNSAAATAGAHSSTAPLRTPRNTA